MIQPSPRSAIGLFSACLLSFLLIMMPFVQIAGASSETGSRLVTINETPNPPILGFVVTKVADTNDGACNADCSLREAITLANSTAGADSITFNIDPGAGPHTIQLSSVLPALSESVDLLNSSGESITVRGEGATDPYRIFAINSGQTVNISNLIITNGATTGAAFPGSIGAGILNEGTLTITNCTVSGNSASAFGGGGVYNFGGTLNLTNSTVSGNHALGGGSGGGVFNNFAGTLNLTNSTVSGNDAASGGGGVHNDANVMTATGSTISDNTANFGGGIQNFGTTLTLTNSTISGNNATTDGGGIYNNHSSGTVTLTSVTVSNNRADNDNNASGTGGGIYIFNTSLQPVVRNTVVAGNFNENGVTDPADNIDGTVSATSSFNLIGTGGAGGLTNGVNNNQVGVASPGLGSLAGNGGPTQTHALQSGSPAIDKGDDFGLATDQRGVSRPVDDPAVTNAAQGEDIGAFEAPLPAPVLTIAKDFSNPGNDPADSPEETATAGTTGNTFFIIVTNTGASTANNVVITDLVPAALTVTNVTGTLGAQVANPTLNDNDIAWSITTLNAGQSVTLTVTYSVGSGIDSQLVNNTATADSDETTPVSDGDDVQVNENVTLTIAKDFSNPGNDLTGDTPEETVTAGSTGNTFFITVTNTGISTADNVLISDVVPSQLTVTNVSGGLGSEVPPSGDNNIQWSIPTLGAGQSVTLTVTYSVGSGVSSQVVNNTASVASDEVSSVPDSDDVEILGAPVTPTVSVQDAQLAEPSSGSVNMVFTVTLSAPAPAGGVTVDFTTQAQAPAINHATAGSDYTSTSGTVNFATGEQIKTINVAVLSDAFNNEQNETFLVILAAPVNGNIADGTATGTILITNQAGTLLISELRTSGPAGAGDDFVEVYNNSSSPHTVNGTGGGYGLFKGGATCNDTPVLIGVIPNGTVIPANGHFLFTGSTYSLANYGGSNAATGDVTLAADIENDRNVSLFSTTSILELSTGTRFDAVGFGANVGGICDLQLEGSSLSPLSGSTLEYSYFRKMCDFVEGVGCSTPGNPKDTNNNASDFLFANTTAAVSPAGQLLGAPGPENLGSPRRSDPVLISASLLDNTQAAAAFPNRLRNSSPDPGNNSTFGTLELRRRIINNTGAPVTRLRFRVVELTTTPAPAGKADLRVRTSSDGSVGGIIDPGTCAAEPGSPAPPCIVTVRGTTLDTPPTQSNGGGLNSSMRSPTVTLGTPLAPGASINVSFMVGVQQTGNFRFLIIVEALP